MVATLPASQLAGAATVPDVALKGILEYGLCVLNLLDVHGVWRLEIQAAKEPRSRGGQKGFIEGARATTVVLGGVFTSTSTASAG